MQRLSKLVSQPKGRPQGHGSAEEPSAVQGEGAAVDVMDAAEEALGLPSRGTEVRNR